MLCRQLRTQKIDTSVLLLTVLDSSNSKVIGLDAGADDYVVKPFDTNELLARIRALIRRGSYIRSSIIEYENIRLDANSSKVTCNGQMLHLTAKEYALLELFMRNSHKIFSQKILLDYLWSSEEVPLENTVRAHIKALRQKLKTAGANNLIETVHGLGYRLKLGKDKIKPAVAELDSQSVFDISVDRSQLQLSSILADLWKRFKPTYSDRITDLEQNTTALLTGTLTEEQGQQAQASAHLQCVCLMLLMGFCFMQSNQLCRILAVDDTVANLYLLKTALEEEGYEVDIASSGSLALAKIEASPPSIVLLDVIMPGINGIEVTRRIRENPLVAEIPILIISGSDETYVAQALDIGANDFIRKPVKVDELLTKIKELCS